jgi:hypothetical protein
MRKWLVMSAIALIVASGAVALAHHSFAATYDDRVSMTLEGSIVQILFRNPHSFVQVEDKDGVRWGIEWGGAAQLAGNGVTRTTLKIGDRVVLTGIAGRNPEDHRMLMRSLLRPSDGFRWGNRPGEVVE